ncbi:DUF72 domain-containing protein [Tardisphaera miroshnichenkoae]
MILVGCANFPTSMEKYFQIYRAVEINRTFYALPREQTLARWRGMAPRGFVFSVKANRGISHDARMNSSEEIGRKALEGTLAAAKVLDAQYILFQTPPSLGPEALPAVRSTLLEARQAGFRVGYEPRGKSWTVHEEELRDALKGVASHVVDPFVGKEVWSEGFHYFRLHGLGERPYVYRFSDEELKKLKDVMKSISGDVLLIFNNTNMLEDSRRFMELLEKSGGLSNKGGPE